MRALVKENNSVQIKTIQQPELQNSDDVIIRVRLAGLCRTDVYVAEGKIDSPENIILGHEFSGTVFETGAAVTNVEHGDRVTVMPVIPCGKCTLCNAGQAIQCQDTQMLGIHFDGAFAEYIRVPASTVYKLPDNVSFMQGAYSEPLAATLSIINAGLKPTEKGLIYGKNRFSKLIKRILNAKGFKDITIFDPQANTSIAKNKYDFAIETLANEDMINTLIQTVKPQGKIIIKSRMHNLVGVKFNDLVMKEITLKAVNYASLNDVLPFLAEHHHLLEGLMGNVYTLDQYESVFKRAKNHEDQKTFFTLENGSCAD